MARRGVRLPGPAPLLLDAGGVFAFARDDKRARGAVTGALERGASVVTSAITVAETTRGNGPRDAAVNRVLRLCHLVPVDDVVARVAGKLLAVSGSSATVDAVVVATAIQLGGALILTSDPGDLSRLAEEHKTVALYRV